LAGLLSLAWSAAPAMAAGDASDVIVEVVDAVSGAPVALARVLVAGETGTIGYTDAEGRARFESVATGAYRASVTKRGYAVARSPLFDVTANRSTTVRVRLARPSTGGLQRIGGVTVTSSPARTSREVGQDDALRHLDGSLRDALGDLPGLTGSGDALSIDGNDPSQTGTSVDGVPIPGAGSSLGDRGINADLFAGASASSGAAHGSLGGDVGFRTLQPTRYAQQQATLQYGSDDASSAIVAARGSIRNLGYVVEHAARGRTNPLTGQTFTDESGLTYRHDGDTFASGDLAKLRWSPSLAQTLTVTGSATDETDGLACAQRTALFPCGDGPGLATHRRGAFATLAENATIGATSVFLAGFTSASRDDADLTHAMFAGVPAPQASQTRSYAHGATLNVQLPAGDHHDLALSASAYGLAVDGTSTNVLGTFALGDRLAYRGATLVDRLRPNQRLTFTARAGVNGGRGNASAAGGLDARWQPSRDVAYDLAGSAGDAGATTIVTGAGLPDPRSLTYDCGANIALGNVASVNAARQRSSSLRASAERSGRHAHVALTAWTQRLQGAPVLAAYDAGALGLPSAYVQSVAQLASSPYVCGAGAAPALAFTGFVPADQLNRGATLAGTWEIGAALIAGFASVQSRFVTAGSPLTNALSPVGAQVPDVPLHRAGLVVTEKLGRAVDLLANLSYTAANNANRLPAYTVVNAGLAAPLRAGTLALVGRNLTNRFPGPYVPAADVVAFPRAGAPPLPLLAQPLTPRSVALTYTVRVGRLGSGGTGAGTTDASSEPDGGGEGGGSGVRIAINAREVPNAAPANALTIDPDNAECTPVAARVAQPVLDKVGATRDAAERAKSGGRYPASLRGLPATVLGLRIVYAAYDDGARFAVSIDGPIRQLAPVVNCANLAIAGPDDVTSHHLYRPAGPPKSSFSVIYSPLVGIYLLPGGPPPRGAVRVQATFDPEPTGAPADPFAERTECPASSKPVADAVVAALRTARAAQRAGTPVASTDVVDLVAHGTGTGAWLEVGLKDDLAQSAVLQCLHVAGIPRQHLKSAGIDDTRRYGVLGFADRFGIYQVSPPDER